MKRRKGTRMKPLSKGGERGKVKWDTKVLTMADANNGNRIPVTDLQKSINEQINDFNKNVYTKKEEPEKPALTDTEPMENIENKELLEILSEPIDIEEITEEETKEIYVDTPLGKRAVVKQEEYQAPDSADTDITDLLEAIDIICQYFTESTEETKRMNNLINECKYETIDLLHAIEFSSQDEEKELKIFQKIKVMRLRRRSYKKKLSYLTEINHACMKSPNMINTLTNLKKKLETIKKKEETTVYAPRIRTDLEENENIKYLTKERAEHFNSLND